MGCLTEALTWIHERGIWHNELFRSHILLGPREVFLSGFRALRYAKGREDADVKYYRSDIWSSGDYLLLEIETSEMYNGPETDVYSLGCVFLHILAAIYTPSIAQPWVHNWEYRDGALNEIASSARAGMLPTNGGQFKRPFISTELIAILGRMKADDEEQRPTMEDVGQALKAANHLEGIFYGPCCSPSQDLRPLELLKSWKHYGAYWAGIGKQFEVEFSHLKPVFQTQLSDETWLAKGERARFFEHHFAECFWLRRVYIPIPIPWNTRKGSDYIKRKFRSARNLTNITIL